MLQERKTHRSPVIFRYVAVSFSRDRSLRICFRQLRIECRSDGFRGMEVLYKTACLSGADDDGCWALHEQAPTASLSHDRNLATLSAALVEGIDIQRSVMLALSWRVRPVVDDRVSTTMDTGSDRLPADRIHALHHPPESVIPGDVHARSRIQMGLRKLP
ncbi:hypothetical protein PV04_08240 [Phialophora macrospora]|uniref:Uncharacterized protein n=1 Tax=Phialophora macrospora TaxID=1851006 RepID=A0A0D2CLD3_9EURO|nr:hypothetical protein PV04_08240 [Phialophora macrospora]